MKIDMKKFLLAGTALVAVSALVPAKAQAQHTLTGAGTWASGATQSSADDGTAANAAAGDTVDVDTFTLTITNDQTADDGSGDLNTFETGAITDTDTGAAGTGTVAVVQDAGGGALDVTVASANVAGNFTVDNDDGADEDVTVEVTGALTTGGDLLITNNDLDADVDVNVTVGGVLTVGGTTTLTANTGAAGANVNLTLGDDADFGTALTLDDDTGLATAIFAGTAAQAVTGPIDGDAAGEGTVSVTNTGGTVTFNDDIGTGMNLLAFTQATGTDVNTVGELNAETITLNGTASLDADDVVAGDVTMGSGSSVDFGAAFTGDITGDGGVQTVTVSGAANIGGGGAFAFGGGNDIFNITGAAVIDAATLNGGTGTNTLTLDGADAQIDSDISNFNVVVDDGDELTLTGNMTGGTITLNGDGAGQGADLVVNAPANTISSTITGSADDDIVTLTDGTLSGNSNLGAGADTFNFDGGMLTGALAFGTGADAMAVGGNVEVAGGMSGLETITTGANTLTVSSAITGVDDADNTGVNVAGGTLEINDGGSIDGAIHEGGGAGTVEFGADAGGGTFNLGGIVEGVTLTVTSGTVNNDGFELGGNDSLAAINVAAAGTLQVEDDVTSGGAITNAGTVRIGAGDTLTAATQTAGAGTWTFEVDDAAGESGLFTLTGGAADLTGATVTVDVGIGNIADGDEILIIDGTGAVVGGPGAVLTDVTDNSFLWDFQIADGTVATVATDNTDIFLFTTAANSISGTATTSGNAAAGNVLTSLNAAGNAQIDDILVNLNAASSADDVNEVLEAVQPTVDGGAFAGSLNVMSNTVGIIGTELASLRTGNETGMAAGNISQGVRMWAQGFGQTATQDRRDNIDGYDADTYGAAVGIDTENLSNGVVGVAFSYGNTQVDSNNANRTDTDVDSYQVTLYGNYDLDRDTYLNGMAAYARSNADTTRHNVGGVAGLTAQGEYDANQYTVRAEAGRDYAYHGMTVTPNVMGHWTHFTADDYTETGAGGANLSVDMDSMDIAELGIGVDASWDLKQSNGAMMRPSIGVGYRYDFVGDKVQATSSFAAGGAAFASQGPDPAQSTFDVGASLDYLTTDNWQFTVNYGFEYKSDYDAHSGFVRAAYKF